MRTITSKSEFIIKPIHTYNNWLKIENVIKSQGIQCDNPSFIRGWPHGIRIANGKLYWSAKASYYDEKWYEKVDMMTPTEFLELYQVFFDYEGFKGSYQLDPETKDWFGSIVGIQDDITYNAKSLVELEHTFIATVKWYKQEIEKHKQKQQEHQEKKMNKELKWKIEIEDSEPIDEVCIVDGKGNYLLKTGKIRDAANIGSTPSDEVYFDDESAAREFIEDMIDSNPEIMYKRPQVKFIDDETALEIVSAWRDSFVAIIVEKLMETEMVFSRHDVLKTIRQILGAGVEVTYTDWKQVIVEAVDTYKDMYDYGCDFILGHFVYSQLKSENSDDDDDDDAKWNPTTDGQIVDQSGNSIPNNPNPGDSVPDAADTSTADSATTIHWTDVATVHADIVPAPADNSEPAAVSNRHTVSAAFVRACGGYPGANMDILVCKGGIFIQKDKLQNALDVSKRGKSVLLHTSLKVDKNCNLRMSKYMFDLAGIGEWFGKKEFDPVK